MREEIQEEYSDKRNPVYSSQTAREADHSAEISPKWISVVTRVIMPTTTIIMQRVGSIVVARRLLA